jgi:hypothetical protein
VSSDADDIAASAFTVAELGRRCRDKSSPAPDIARQAQNSFGECEQLAQVFTGGVPYCLLEQVI